MNEGFTAAISSASKKAVENTEGSGAQTQAGVWAWGPDRETGVFGGACTHTHRASPHSPSLSVHRCRKAHSVEEYRQVVGQCGRERPYRGQTKPKPKIECKQRSRRLLLLLLPCCHVLLLLQVCACAAVSSQPVKSLLKRGRGKEAVHMPSGKGGKWLGHTHKRRSIFDFNVQ